MLNAITKLLSSPNGSVADSKVDPPQTNEDVFGAFSIDEYRPMRIAIIGAGASGILAGIR